MKKALITGITGQDGSYLAELLLQKGYEVHGMVRRLAVEDPRHRFSRINHLLNDDLIKLHAGTLDSYPSIYRLIAKVKPDEIYHLAAQSFVSNSFEDEFSTMATNINGTHFMLSACAGLVPTVRFYFAASSEMFGKVEQTPQSETTPFHPRSPYGISKVAGFDLTRYYRERNDSKMFALSGILFNHESPRRGVEFVTRKITNTAVKIKLGLAKELKLGNIETERDWGFAKDYVEAMWLMLQKEKPQDYVIATGETHSVGEFTQLAFATLGLNWKDYVIANNPGDIRPLEVSFLRGDNSKAQKELGWKPRVKFEELVELMVKSDYDSLKKTALK